MPVDTTDTKDNSVSLHAHGDEPRVIRRDTNTIVLHLNSDEILTLISDLAGAAWAGSAHIVIEADAITYPSGERVL